MLNNQKYALKIKLQNFIKINGNLFQACEPSVLKNVHFVQSNLVLFNIVIKKENKNKPDDKF